MKTVPVVLAAAPVALEVPTTGGLATSKENFQYAIAESEAAIDGWHDAMFVEFTANVQVFVRGSGVIAVSYW